LAYQSALARRSIHELLYIRHVIRNVKGLQRVLERQFKRA
jgi:hypothetical protein